ncbi:MAG: sel1 repeat family protein, partial [Elusimicrobiota bacterium]|jgi:TPR repeat protein|nr:sel1 repeat family protein [Elusimicrobiota bacterium]
MMYFEGKGVKQDADMAAALLVTAADKGGYAPAQFILGSWQEYGKLYKAAAEFYRQAAEQGFSLAQYSLGLLYLKGQGVKQDKKQAHFWLEKSANQGYEKAQEALKNLPK